MTRITGLVSELTHITRHPCAADLAGGASPPSLHSWCPEGMQPELGALPSKSAAVETTDRHEIRVPPAAPRSVPRPHRAPPSHLDRSFGAAVILCYDYMNGGILRMMIGSLMTTWCRAPT